MSSWSPETSGLYDEEEGKLRYIPLAVTITLFLQSEEMPTQKEYRCMNCGLVIGSTNRRVAFGADNEGPLDTSKGYWETQCKRCKQHYKIYL